jgi:hypothetical protein
VLFSEDHDVKVTYFTALVKHFDNKLLPFPVAFHNANFVVWQQKAFLVKLHFYLIKQHDIK